MNYYDCIFFYIIKLIFLIINMQNNQMKYAGIDQYGGVDVLKIMSRDIP